jgi:aromatic ring-opening dioxygenase catalytic subunit (LigB family)
MGQIVGAALVSHHPGLQQCEEFRLLMGNGTDSDLVAGYGRIRERIDAVKPDVLMIIDSHWFTTGYHVIDGGKHYQGTLVSDEMPWYLHGVHYDYAGCPDLAHSIHAVAHERGVKLQAITNPGLPRLYGTINLVTSLRRTEQVVSVSCCQNCEWPEFLVAGAVLAEGIRRSNRRVVILASGALSHKFNDIHWVQKHPSIFHESNVSRPDHIARDKEAMALFAAGRHDQVIDLWDDKFRPTHWEAQGGHYLQMVGALGGRECRSKGTACSAYENARGTGNTHIWFEM